MNSKSITIGIIAVLLVIFIGAIVWTQTNDQENNYQNVPTPTATMRISPTNSQDDNKSLTPTTTEEEQVTVSLVSLENVVGNSATFGCGDSLVSVEREPSFEGETDIESALITLFNIQANSVTEDEEEVYNALSQSNLIVESIETSGNTTKVYLTGQLQLAGTCDNPRLEEQLISTVQNNTDAENVEIFINDQPLDEVLTEQG